MFQFQVTFTFVHAVCIFIAYSAYCPPFIVHLYIWQRNYNKVLLYKGITSLYYQFHCSLSLSLECGDDNDDDDYDDDAFAVE